MSSDIQMHKINPHEIYTFSLAKFIANKLINKIYLKWKIILITIQHYVLSHLVMV